MDNFTRAIVVAAFSTAVLSVLVVWLLTNGDWYFQVGAGLAAWAVCWLSMGFCAAWDEEAQ